MTYESDTIGHFGCTGSEGDLFECGDGQWSRDILDDCPSQENVVVNCRKL